MPAFELRLLLDADDADAPGFYLDADASAHDDGTGALRRRGADALVEGLGRPELLVGYLSGWPRAAVETLPLAARIDELLREAHAAGNWIGFANLLRDGVGAWLVALPHALGEARGDVEAMRRDVRRASTVSDWMAFADSYRHAHRTARGRTPTAGYLRRERRRLLTTWPTDTVPETPLAALQALGYLREAEADGGLLLHHPEGVPAL